MRATVRAGFTKRRTRAGVVTAKLGAVVFSMGVVTLAGAFFTGPALAQQGVQAPRGFVMNHEPGHEEPPCGDIPPAPPCPTTAPPPPPSTEPPPPPPTTKPPKPPTSVPPSKIRTTKPGGGSGGNQDNQPGGGAPADNGPQLPATGAEVNLLVGAGAALVGGGAALVVVARRRRAALVAESDSSTDQS